MSTTGPSGFVTAGQLLSGEGKSKREPWSCHGCGNRNPSYLTACKTCGHEPYQGSRRQALDLERAKKGSGYDNG